MNFTDRLNPIAMIASKPHSTNDFSCSNASVWLLFVATVTTTKNVHSKCNWFIRKTWCTVASAHASEYLLLVNVSNKFDSWQNQKRNTPSIQRRKQMTTRAKTVLARWLSYRRWRIVQAVNMRANEIKELQHDEEDRKQKTSSSRRTKKEKLLYTLIFRFDWLRNEHSHFNQFHHFNCAVICHIFVNYLLSQQFSAFFTHQRPIHRSSSHRMWKHSSAQVLFWFIILPLNLFQMIKKLRR